MPAPPKFASSWLAAPLVVLVGSLALTLLGTMLAEQALRRRDQAIFHHDTRQVDQAIQQAAATVATLLRGVGGLATSGALDRDRFAAFVGSLDLPQEYPGVQGLGWAPVVTPQARAEFLARLRLYDPSYRIWPDPGARTSVPVAELEPQDERNRAAIGFDMASEPRRAATMHAACDAGQPRLSPSLTLVQEIRSPRQPGFLLYLPIYRSGGVPTSIADRRDELVGFAYAPLRAHDFLRTAFAQAQVPLAVSVRDLGPEAEQADLAQPPQEEAAASGLRQTSSVSVFGRTWTVTYAALPALSASRDVVLVIALVGSIGSILLCWITVRLKRSHDRAVESAQELAASEAALTRSEARVRFIAEASGLLAQSLEHERTLANVAMAAVPTFADWAGVDLVRPDGTLAHLTVAHRDPQKVRLAEELQRRYPPSAAEPPATVVASRQTLLVTRITDAMLAGTARDSGHLALLRALGPVSVIITPLLGTRGVLGTLTFCTAESGRHYTPEDVAVAEDLARRATVAIEHARLFAETDALRRQAEATTTQLARQAQELAQSNDELEQFAYIASHDLQEPLRMVTSYLELLQRRFPDRFAGQPSEFMNFALEGARRMQALIRDLLLYSRVGRTEGPAEPVAVDAVLGEVLANLRGAIQDQQARIEQAGLPTVVFARSQLLQLLQNLIGNALKFHGEQPPVVTVSAVQGEDGWTFTVQDNGIGIDPAHAERIFELFQRLHSRDEYEGTGIGLAICRKIVERRGGRIWVEPAPGGGTAFRFTVPDRVPTAPAPRAGLPTIRSR